MKGVIFNVVEDVVTEAFGPDAWDAMLERAGVDGAYTGLGNYDDGELHALVAAAAAELDRSPADVLELVGQAAFPHLAARYPDFDAYADSRSLLVSLNEVIHPQVLVLYPGSVVPTFEATVPAPELVVLRYRSERALCHLAVGLSRGAVLAFGETATTEQEECRLRGGDECRIVVRYDRP